MVCQNGGCTASSEGDWWEELPKEFRCVSVDLQARRAIVHRRGLLADVVGCSLRVPGLYAPIIYDGTLHVDGGVLDNLPVAALAREEGPLIAVSIGTNQEARPASATKPARSHGCRTSSTRSCAP